MLFWAEGTEGTQNGGGGQTGIQERESRNRPAGTGLDTCREGAIIANAGFYESVAWQKKYPRVQILTVSDLLAGKRIDYPPRTSVTFKKAPKAKAKGGKQTPLL